MTYAKHIAFFLIVLSSTLPLSHAQGVEVTDLFSVINQPPNQDLDAQRKLLERELYLGTALSFGMSSARLDTVLSPNTVSAFVIGPRAHVGFRLADQLSLRASGWVQANFADIKQLHLGLAGDLIYLVPLSGEMFIPYVGGGARLNISTVQGAGLGLGAVAGLEFVLYENWSAFVEVGLDGYVAGREQPLEFSLNLGLNNYY